MPSHINIICNEFPEFYDLLITHNAPRFHPCWYFLVKP